MTPTTDELRALNVAIGCEVMGYRIINRGESPWCRLYRRGDDTADVSIRANPFPWCPSEDNALGWLPDFSGSEDDFAEVLQELARRGLGFEFGSNLVWDGPALRERYDNDAEIAFQAMLLPLPLRCQAALDAVRKVNANG